VCQDRGGTVGFLSKKALETLAGFLGNRTLSFELVESVFDCSTLQENPQSAFGKDSLQRVWTKNGRLHDLFFNMLKVERLAW
jgi:hypothetical protein